MIPLVFSLAIFALPVARSLGRTFAAKKVAAENARLAILREVFDLVEREAWWRV